MKPFTIALLFFIAATAPTVKAQQSVDKVKFFSDTSVVDATLSLNIKKVMAKKEKVGLIFPATFSAHLDSSVINDPISVEVRGHFRRGFCYLPPLKLIYKNNPKAAFYHLKSLKLVSGCQVSKFDEQNLLKEYIIYKLYNLITDKSFRVRLLNLSYKDSSGVRKTVKQHAFLIEDIKEVAKRNGCAEWAGKEVPTERTDRRQMTMVAVFEYMIGNTDWSVPVNHNTRLLHSLSDSLSRPYVVPYDFDFSGLVNTTYSAPDERLGIDNVRERLYRGFPRSVDELNDVLTVFKNQKSNIYATINNFNLFLPATKKDITGYLDQFYKTIDNPSDVKKVFITDARTN